MIGGKGSVTIEHERMTLYINNVGNDSSLFGGIVLATIILRTVL